jgi:hypothetical protein
MTTDEAIKHLFHPNVVEGLKEHLEEIDSRKPDPKPRKRVTK